MKQKLYLILSLLFTQFFCFGQTLDQQNAPVSVGGGAFNVSSTQFVGQSFTAGLTGDLSQISIRIGNYGSFFSAGDFQMRIYNGEGYGGTVLNTTVFTISSSPAVSNYDELTVVLSSLVPVTNGNKYTIDFRGITGTVNTHGTGGGGATYTNGTFYSNGSPFTFYSLWFKTFVNLPTPATHLNFDGVNDNVNCGNSINSALDPLNTITVEAWVRPTTNTGLGVIVGNYANSNQSAMQFLLRRDNNGYAFWIQGTAGFKSVITTNTVILNTWQHVVGVWNGSDLKIYIDGSLIATTAGVTDSSFATTTNSMMIGNNQAGTGAERFTGNIDEVRIWTTARTIEQINGSKNCELQGNETSLLAYYNFNQGIDQANNTTITSLSDITTNGYNGTLNNFALTGSTSNWLAGSPVTTGSIVPSNATVTTPVVYNQGATASALTATTGANGTGLLWYTTATGGTGSTTAPTPSTATPGTTSYWVSSTNANGCESARAEIVVQVNAPATHLNFDGTNDFVISANAITNNTENQTYQAWFRIPSIPTNNDRILQRGSDGSGGWSVQLDVTSTGKLSAGISASPDTYLTGTTTLVPNTWYHATFIFENNNSLRLYLNGNLEASVSIGNRTLRNSDNRLRIGTGNIASEYFNGSIDEVRVWNKVLSVTAIMNTKDCELQAGETGLVAYYKFNQGFDNSNNAAITSATDSSVNNNNGTLTNFSLTGSTSNWKSGSVVTTGNTCATLNSNSFEVANKIKMYPNPTSSFITVEMDNLTNARLQVIDVTGKVLMNQSLLNNSNSVNVQSLPAGMYFFKVTSNEGTSTNKIIKN